MIGVKTRMLGMTWEFVLAKLGMGYEPRLLVSMEETQKRKAASKGSSGFKKVKELRRVWSKIRDALRDWSLWNKNMFLFSLLSYF